MPLFSVSVSGILCGAAIGIITVFIAAQSPAKQAAKVSPQQQYPAMQNDQKILFMRQIQGFSK